MIGVAFSLGFIFGPSIGAVFSILGRSGSDGVQSLSSFQYPALFAFSLALLDIILLLLFMPETLPPQKRVRKENNLRVCILFEVDLCLSVCVG